MFATAIALVAGCSMTRPESSKLLPIAHPGTFAIETETQETSEARNLVSVVTPVETISIDIDTPADTEETAPSETTAKKVAQKAKKTVKKAVKKTKKVTKKVTKKTKKTAKKTSKKTAAKKLFTYGMTNYVNGNVTVTVKITDDNKASVEVNNRMTDKDRIYHCEHFSFTGTIDKKTGVLNYSDCKKVYITGTNSGKNVRTNFTDGTGTLKFCGSNIIWTDDNSKTYQSAKFTKA